MKLGRAERALAQLERGSPPHVERSAPTPLPSPPPQGGRGRCVAGAVLFWLRLAHIEPSRARLRCDCCHELCLGDFELAGPFFAVGAWSAMPSARRLPFDQVLDLHDAARLLVLALDDGERGVAAVGVFHLRPHAGVAEIELGRNAGVAKWLTIAW